MARLGLRAPPRLRALIALKAARATLAATPALPGARALATTRRAQLICWDMITANRSRNRTGEAREWETTAAVLWAIEDRLEAHHQTGMN